MNRSAFSAAFALTALLALAPAGACRAAPENTVPVNVVCALILGHAHHGHGDHQLGHHHHDHQGHDAHGSHGHHDLNLRSAYIHVIADAATSLLAIVALLGGWAYGWSWLDPVMGIAGAMLVAIWAKGLLTQTGKVLLDREMDAPVVEEIREVVETGPERGDTRITDLHVWRVGKAVYSCALTVVTHDRTLTPAEVKQLLSVLPRRPSWRPGLHLVGRKAFARLDLRFSRASACTPKTCPPGPTNTSSTQEAGRPNAAPAP